jgi:hypothetical protein
MAELPSSSACRSELATLASRIDTRVLWPLPGASSGLSVISSSVRAGTGVLTVRVGGGAIVSSSSTVSTTVDASMEALEASKMEVSCGSSSLIAYMSGRGLNWDDRVLRVEDEGGSSVSSFLLFADVFASFALCVVTGKILSPPPAELAGCSRITGVRRLDRCGGNSDAGGISG